MEGNLQAAACQDDIVDVFHRFQAANEQDRFVAIIFADRTRQGQVNMVRQHRHIGQTAHRAIISPHGIGRDGDMVRVADDEALDKARD